MGGELILIHKIDNPVTDLTRYNELINEIKSLECFAIVEKPITLWKSTEIGENIEEMKSDARFSSTISDQDDDYAFGIKLKYISEKPPGHFILFPKNPNKHHVLSKMHWRTTDYFSTKPLEKELKKLSKAFPKTFKFMSDDYTNMYGFDIVDYRDRTPSPILDFTACSSDNCGWCGKCDNY